MSMNIRIKEIMQQKGINNVVLADKLGISKQAVGKMINAESLTTASLEKIASALDVPVWQLLISPDDVTIDKDEFCAFIRRSGVHYTADSEDEFWEIIEELLTVCGRR